VVKRLFGSVFWVFEGLITCFLPENVHFAPKRRQKFCKFVKKMIVIGDKDDYDK
jgi:hypothetical protein